MEVSSSAAVSDSQRRLFYLQRLGIRKEEVKASQSLFCLDPRSPSLDQRSPSASPQQTYQPPPRSGSQRIFDELVESAGNPDEPVRGGSSGSRHDRRSQATRPGHAERRQVSEKKKKSLTPKHSKHDLLGSKGSHTALNQLDIEAADLADLRAEDELDRRLEDELVRLAQSKLSRHDPTQAVIAARSPAHPPPVWQGERTDDESDGGERTDDEGEEDVLRRLLEENVPTTKVSSAEICAEGTSAAPSEDADRPEDAVLKDRQSKDAWLARLHRRDLARY